MYWGRTESLRKEMRKHMGLFGSSEVESSGLREASLGGSRLCLPLGAEVPAQDSLLPPVPRLLHQSLFVVRCGPIPCGAAACTQHVCPSSIPPRISPSISDPLPFQKDLSFSLLPLICLLFCSLFIIWVSYIREIMRLLNLRV